MKMVVFWIKCPYNNSVINLVSRLGLMALGIVGLTFFNIWVAVVYLIYSVLFNFLLFPTMHCQYCYYAVKETTTDSKTGEPIKKLLSKDKWKESCLEKHVACGKKWSINFYISWFVPIVLIIISLFLSFSIYAVMYLIGFIGVLALMLYYTRMKICPRCEIMEECHSAF